MNREKWNVAVLMGGLSAEREVSLRSGAAVAQALAEAGMAVTTVDVQGPDFALPADTDVAFIALHGTFGEDGGVQKVLEQRGVPYTGSGVEASALAFNKAAAKDAFVADGVPTPASVTLGHWDLDVARVTRLKLPLVVKPARQGSSVGVRIVQLHAELQQACLEAWHHDRDLVVEEFVKGRELTVGVLGQDVLPVIEVRPKHEFFTFDAKYNDGQTEYDVPANLTPLETAQAQALARRAHECLGCRDMSRVDIILGEDGHMVVLEVNTIPGFTKTSLLPKAASKAGLDFPRLCLRLAEMALERRADKQRASGRERELAACAT